MSYFLSQPFYSLEYAFQNALRIENKFSQAMNGMFQVNYIREISKGTEMEVISPPDTG